VRGIARETGDHPATIPPERGPSKVVERKIIERKIIERERISRAAGWRRRGPLWTRDERPDRPERRLVNKDWMQPKWH